MRNPFRNSGTAAPPYFTDREPELHRILESLRTPKGKMLVWGERRMGKTSCLMVALHRHRETGGQAILADLSTASSMADVTNGLLTAAGRALSPSWKEFGSDLLRRVGLTLQMSADASTGMVMPSVEIGLRSAPEDAQRASLEQVLTALDEMAGARGVTLGIVLDEFQEIHRLGGEGAEWQLRGILQHQKHISWVLAGSRPQLIARMLEKERAYYETLNRLEFGPMDPEHFGRWIEDRMLIGRVRARGMGARCIALAGPRTGDVVELARKAYDLAFPEGVLDAAMVRRAFDELVEEADALARPFWEGLTPHQQNVLRAVAAGEPQLTGQEARIRFALRSSAAVSKALREFVESGRLVRSPEGAYAFDSPYLRAWVVRYALPDLGAAMVRELGP